MEDEYYDTEQKRGWHVLFQKLHQTAKAQAGPQTEARKPTNIPRNRYRDVLPIDETRVKLNSDECDYINANFVKDNDVQRCYILCQGPLLHTCSHFWQMVWEQNSKGIVMLNKCIERSMNKCHPYWPQGIDEPIVEYDQFRIELISSEDMHSYRLSHLQLENLASEEEPRVILHFHYTRWPDFGVPKTADDFLEFLEAIRKSGVLEEDVGPCVVHCSAGIGRSGTLVLVDVCLKKIEKCGNMNLVDLKETLLDMRKQRLGLIQTPDQLRFSYVAVLQKCYNDAGPRASVYSDDDEDEEEEVNEGSESEEMDDDQEEDDVVITNGITAFPRNPNEPPPLPPRPPDLLRDVSPDPPPPPMAPPPGPPEYTTPEKDDVVRYNEAGTTVQDQPSDNRWYMDQPEEDRQRELESSQEEEAPPPPPPRKESNFIKMRSDSPIPEDHFLGLGNGGDDSPPPSPQETPPLRPPRDVRVPIDRHATMSHSMEENALISELNELQRIIDKKQTKEEDLRHEEDLVAKEATELRRRQRIERDNRLQSKVQEMQTKLRKEESNQVVFPWLLTGLAIIMVSYIGYYWFIKS